MNKKKLATRLKKDYSGMLFILPVILGLIIFTFYPMITSFINSFYKISITGVKNYVGLENYKLIFGERFKEVSESLALTIGYTLIFIPVNMILSFSLALLLNKEIPAVGVFRVLCYAPVVIPTVVNGLLWQTVTASDTGYINLILKALNLKPLGFFERAETAFPTFICVSLFGIGSGMIIWLSQLKNIPKSMYEAAEIEGAKPFICLTRITIPLCSPTIFFNLVLNVIGTLQIFDLAFIFKNPLNQKSLNFFVVYIYNQAFETLGQMGYASALSWVLFAIIAILSLIVFRTNKWVYYGEDTD